MIWSSCSPDFGVQGIVDRFLQIKPKILITCEHYFYNGKKIDILEKIPQILKKIKSIKKVIVFSYDNEFEKKLDPKYTNFNSVLEKSKVNKVFKKFCFNHPLYILYSSGTTGIPKCITHGAGNALIEHNKEFSLHCNISNSDKIFYYTTTGWMMWNWLVGGLSRGATLYLYDGSPTYPNDVHLSSISGGTDVVGCLVLGNIFSNVYAGEIQGESLGIDVDIFNEKGESVGANHKGELVIKNPFPTIPIKFWNDMNNKKLKKAYFSKYKNVWYHGDFIQKTQNGGFIMLGRSDTTLNPGGVRMGTAEIYRQVENIEFVRESLVVGQNWKNDVRIILFVVMETKKKLGVEEINFIKSKVKDNCSPKHVPHKIIEIPEIPKTKSGKIVELAVKKAIHGENIENLEALSNPESLKFFKNLYDKGLLNE